MLRDLKTQLGQSMHSVRRFLQRPIQLQEGHVKLGSPAASLRDQARDAERLRVRRMKRELFQLLEQHPNSRELMRHLDLVERTLRQEGFKGVEALPVRVIAKALHQLEKLVWDWSAAGLAELRSRMAVIVKNRPRAAAEEAAATTAAAELEIGTPGMADVSEVDHATFEEMERSWSGQTPSGFAEALAAARQTAEA